MTAADPVAPSDPPPSLRQRGPARLNLALRTGRCPDMARSRVHVRAGRTLVVLVVPPAAGVKVEVTAEPPLLVSVPVSRVEGGPVPTYHAEYVGHTAGRLSPFPTTVRLRVVVIDGRPDPFRLTIPVVIWPSVWTLLVWWTAAFLGIVWSRWQHTLAHGSSLRDVFPQLLEDAPYLFGLLSLGALVLVPLRLAGWLMTLGDPGGDDA